MIPILGWRRQLDTLSADIEGPSIARFFLLLAERRASPNSSSILSASGLRLLMPFITGEKAPYPWPNRAGWDSSPFTTLSTFLSYPLATSPSI